MSATSERRGVDRGPRPLHLRETGLDLILEDFGVDIRRGEKQFLDVVGLAAGVDVALQAMTDDAVPHAVRDDVDRLRRHRREFAQHGFEHALTQARRLFVLEVGADAIGRGPAVEERVPGNCRS